jgi:inosine-uridine nucleoside N-ribohydrolase
LIRTKEEVNRWEKLYGKVVYKGAWNEAPVDSSQAAADRRRYHGPFEVPPLPEGNPRTKPADEDAAHFIIRMLNQYPHEVTIYAGGPLTDLALAIAIDPRVPELAQELVIMGGAVNPGSADPEFSESPRREFNFWWDPEAARIVLRALWPRITVTTVDISIKTRLRKAMIEEIGKAQMPVAQYLARWADEEYMWDELAAAVWLDPSVITKEELLYMSTTINHGAGYGETLVWSEGNQPGLGERLVHIPTDLDREKFYRMFIDLMTRPTPGAQSPQAIH